MHWYILRNKTNGLKPDLTYFFSLKNRLKIILILQTIKATKTPEITDAMIKIKKLK